MLYCLNLKAPKTGVIIEFRVSLMAMRKGAPQLHLDANIYAFWQHLDQKQAATLEALQAELSGHDTFAPHTGANLAALMTKARELAALLEGRGLKADRREWCQGDRHNPARM